MASRPLRSADTLVVASWHVFYEWTMLEDTHSLMSASDLAHNHRRSALLESFIVHVRNHYEFFWQPAKGWRNNDIAVDDFFDGNAAWRGQLNQPPALLSSDMVNRMHREIAHLSYDRLEPDRPTEWEVTALLNIFRPVITSFRNAAPSHYLHPIWRGEPPLDRPVPYPVAFVGTMRPNTGLITPGWAVSTPGQNAAFNGLSRPK